jgi:hypothetical protein
VMDMSLKDFIDLKAERKNSAFTKLKLLINGVQDAPNIFKKFENIFKEEHYAYDNGNWGVDKNRLTPTEVLLPGGIVSKLHIRPDSPISLKEDNGKLYILLDNKVISEFKFLPRPNFWNFTIINGTPTKNLAQMYGLNSLNFNIFSGCEFWNVGKGCRFCSVKSTVCKDNPIEIKKSPQELADVCELVTKYDDINYIIVTGGSYFNQDEEFNAHMDVIKAIRYKLPWNGKIKGNISMMPPKDIKKLNQLYENEVENPSFNMEAWPKENFEKICPGKAEYVGFDHVVASLMYLQELYGPGKVWSNFVAGIVPLEDMKKGFTFMAERGIIPGANIYHAEVGSMIGKKLGRIDENYVLDLYKHAAELYHKYDYKPFFDAGVLRNSLANEVYEGLL